MCIRDSPSTPPALAGGTTGFGMGPGGSPPRSLTPGTPPHTTRHSHRAAEERLLLAAQAPRDRQRAAASVRRDTDRRRRGPPPRPWHNRPRPCAPLRSNGCPLSTRGRSTRSSAGGLILSKQDAINHLPVGFPLRCAQRFSHPDVATRRCCLGNNRHTSGRSSPVLSY